jgi:hypothetical protein
MRADDCHQERQHVGAHDARVAHQRDIRDGAGEAEAAALYDIAEDEPGQDGGGPEDKGGVVHGPHASPDDRVKPLKS